MRISKIHGLFAGVLMAMSMSVSAGVINFQELNGEAEVEGLGTVYTAQGFVFTYTPAPNEPYPTAWASIGPNYQFNNGTTAIVCNSDNATCSLKHRRNETFALLAIDLAEVNGNGNAPTSVTFSGLTKAGKTVTHTVSLDGIMGFERFFFPASFRNLKEVTWQQGDNVNNGTHFLDNVVVVLSDFQPAND